MYNGVPHIAFRDLNSTKRLTFFTFSFSGNYTCEVEWSPEKPPVSLSHYLEVCVPPSVHAVNTEGGSFVDVKEGDNATLECEADGIPGPTIHWVSTKARVIRLFLVVLFVCLCGVC